MIEDLVFQELGIRQLSKHKIDPSVIIQIEQAIINCPPDVHLTGLLFGKQHPNNLVISAAFTTFIGSLSENFEFKFSETLESILKYYESVYSLNCVGLFAAKHEFDRESTVQFSNAFKFKSTTDFIYLKVDMNQDTFDFQYEAYTSMKNTMFQDFLIYSQKVPIEVDFVHDNFLKSTIISHSGHILQ